MNACGLSGGWRPFNHNTILGFTEPIIGLQVTSVLSGVIDSNHRGNFEQIFCIEASPSLRGCEFNATVILALNLLLVRNQEVKVPDVIKDEGMVVCLGGPGCSKPAPTRPWQHVAFAKSHYWCGPVLCVELCHTLHAGLMGLNLC